MPRCVGDSFAEKHMDSSKAALRLMPKGGGGKKCTSLSKKQGLWMKNIYIETFFSKVCSLQRSCYKLKVYFSACRLLHVFIITMYSKHIEFDDIILVFKWKWNWLEGESFHFWDFSVNSVRMGIRWDALRNWRIKTIMFVHIVKKLSGRRNRNLNYFQPIDVP